jgi:hypothetical protein
MPYTRPIVITRENVETLRDCGAGACLTWHEETGAVETVLPWETSFLRRMIIVSRRGLDELTDMYTADGHEVTNEDLARDLSDIASDYLLSWPEIRTMSLMCEDVRRRLADAGVYLTAGPTPELPVRGLPRMTDHYRLVGGDRLAEVTFTWAFTEPTRILTRDPVNDAQPVADLALGTGGTLTHRAMSDLIASTVIHGLDLNR